MDSYVGRRAARDYSRGLGIQSRQRNLNASFFALIWCCHPPPPNPPPPRLLRLVILIGAIPESLGKLTNLEELFLHGNSLTGDIPPSLGNLKCLRKLFLNSNDLVGPVPPELGRLGSLDTLNLSWNNLRGEVPAGVRALVSLFFHFVFFFVVVRTCGALRIAFLLSCVFLEAPEKTGRGGGGEGRFFVVVLVALLMVTHKPCFSSMVAPLCARGRVVLYVP